MTPEENVEILTDRLDLANIKIQELKRKLEEITAEDLDLIVCPYCSKSINFKIHYEDTNLVIQVIMN